MDHVTVTLDDDELVAELPDGRTLADPDPVRLAELLLSEGVTADLVKMPDWSEGDRAPLSGHKAALLSRMRRGPTYEISPRPPAYGGGWRLRLIEDGEEVGGGVFPPVEGIEDREAASQAAYEDAHAEAMDWMNSRAPNVRAALWPSPTV